MLCEDRRREFGGVLGVEGADAFEGVRGEAFARGPVAFGGGEFGEEGGFLDLPGFFGVGGEGVGVGGGVGGAGFAEFGSSM